MSAPKAHTRLRTQDTLARSLVAVATHILHQQTAHPPRRVCPECGGLRRDTRGGCDVCTALRRIATRDHIAEETRYLLGTDSAQNIARRLGYKDADSLITTLQRWGHRDLATRLQPGHAA